MSHSAVVGRREPRPECVNVTPPPALEILITGTVIVDVGLIVEVVDDCDPFNVVGRRLWRSCSGVASDSTGIATITAADAGEWSSAEYHRDGSSGPALGGVSSLVMRVRMPASVGDCRVAYGGNGVGIGGLCGRASSATGLRRHRRGCRRRAAALRSVGTVGNGPSAASAATAAVEGAVPASAPVSAVATCACV